MDAPTENIDFHSNYSHTLLPGRTHKKDSAVRARCTVPLYEMQTEISVNSPGQESLQAGAFVAAAGRERFIVVAKSLSVLDSTVKELTTSKSHPGSLLQPETK